MLFSSGNKIIGFRLGSDWVQTGFRLGSDWVQGVSVGIPWSDISRLSQSVHDLFSLPTDLTLWWRHGLLITSLGSVKSKPVETPRSQIDLYRCYLHPILKKNEQSWGFQKTRVTSGELYAAIIWFPSTSLVWQNAATLVCCEAPKMFCRLIRLGLNWVTEWNCPLKDLSYGIFGVTKCFYLWFNNILSWVTHRLSGLC